MDELPEHLKDWIYLGEDKGLLPEDFAVWLVDKATLLQAIYRIHSRYLL